MKTLYLAIASILLLNPSCAGQKWALPPAQAISASAVLSSENEFLLGLPTPLATAALTPPATPKDSSLGINTIVPEFARKPNGASPTSESSSLLLFSIGLFVLLFFSGVARRKKIFISVLHDLRSSPRSGSAL